jgi:RND superfamily putative drug exporter
MVARIGSWCYRRRRAAVGLWLFALVALFAASQVIGNGFDAGQEIPGSETGRGFDVLDEYFGGVGNGLSGQIVFQADQGVNDPEVVAAMEAMFAVANELTDATITSPYSGFGGAISDDETIAFAEVALSSDVNQETSGEVGEQIRDLVPDVDGLTVEIGGESLAGFEPPESELIGIAFAIVILILATGSVIAMGLSIGTAVLGVVGGVTLATLNSNIFGGPEFATVIAVMIGLGVGIDYALFIINRFRDELHKGSTPDAAIAVAMATSGRAVLFAGITVVLSLLGLMAIGLPFVTGIGVSASSTVLVSLIASLTLLPALLGFASDHVELTRIRGLLAAGLVAVAALGIGLGLTPLVVGLPLAALVLVVGFFFSPLQRELPPRAVPDIRETRAYAWSRFVQARPWTIAIAGTLVLLALSAPIFSLRLGFSDEGNYAEDTTTRRAYELISDGFGPGFNGPLILTVVDATPADAPAIAALASAIETDPGVAAVDGPIPSDRENPPASEAFLLRVTPTTSPQDVETEHLVGRLRDEVIPAAIAGTPLVTALTGGTAASIDFSDYLAGRTLIFFGAVLLISFLLLTAVFRSLLVPLKAVVMNLLSISAAYGVVIAIFQWGWTSDLTGIQAAPIEPFIPMMMFAIVFGLSMDYEVFLLSRIREEYDRTGNAGESVADGLAGTARVITAAAAIMAVVFGSFLLEDNRVTQTFGTGLAAAIVLDATLVRMLLVPATMELLGSKNWWIPGWLDRILPRIELEGPAARN